MTFSLNSLHVSNGSLAPELLISFLPAAPEERSWSYPGKLESVRFMLIERRLAEMMDRTIVICCDIAFPPMPEVTEKPGKTVRKSYRRPTAPIRSSVCCWRL